MQHQSASLESLSALIRALDELKAAVNQQMEILGQEPATIDCSSMEYITVSEAAEMLKVSPSWIYTRIKRKTNPIPHLDDGVVRIPVEGLRGWLGNANVQTPPTKTEK